MLELKDSIDHVGDVPTSIIPHRVLDLNSASVLEDLGAEPEVAHLNTVETEDAVLIESDPSLRTYDLAQDEQGCVNAWRYGGVGGEILTNIGNVGR